MQSLSVFRSGNTKRNRDGELSAFSGLTVYLDLTVHKINKRLYNLKTQPTANNTAFRRIMFSGKGFKQMGLVFFTDTNAAVRYDNTQRRKCILIRRKFIDRQSNRSIIRGVFHCVTEQIHNDFPYLHGIADHVRMRQMEVFLYSKMFLGNLVIQKNIQCVLKLGKIPWLFMQSLLPIFNTCHFQNISNQ